MTFASTRNHRATAGTGFFWSSWLFFWRCIVFYIMIKWCNLEKFVDKLCTILLQLPNMYKHLCKFSHFLRILNCIIFRGLIIEKIFFHFIWLLSLLCGPSLVSFVHIKTTRTRNSTTWSPFFLVGNHWFHRSNKMSDYLHVDITNSYIIQYAGLFFFLCFSTERFYIVEIGR